MIERLTSLNGGTAIVLTHVNYFDDPVIPDFETLFAEIEAADYVKKTLEQEKIIAVSNSLSLPKMEVGYHYQGVLSQTYNGIHTGISLPLWESKNTVKLQKAKTVYVENAISDYANGHFYEMKQLYGRYESLKGILEVYQKINDSMLSIQLL